jgi:phosphatidylglycerophosphatase A
MNLKLQIGFGRLPPDLPIAHPAVWLATWFGAGLLPIAPGSWGSLAALPFAALIVWWTGNPLMLLPAAAIAFFVGIWAGGVYAEHLGIGDPGPVVIDEVAAQWLTLSVVPLDPVLYGVGFFLFRLADTIKPWPANWLDRNLKGGLGIMLDDLVAGFYSTAALYLVHRWLI